MRTRRDSTFLLGFLLGITTNLHATGTARHIERALDRLRERFAGPLGGQSVLAPQAVRDGGANGPIISLAHLSDPLALERRLRELVSAPYTTVRLSVPGGKARLGDFSVGSSETVTGHLLVIRGKADVYGRLDGNLVTLDGDILVHPGAVVTGDALALGGQVRNLGGAIAGESRSLDRSETPAPAEAGTAVKTLYHAAGMVGVFLTLALIGIALVLFGRPQLEVVSDTVAHSFLRSFGVGLLAQVLIVPTFGMLVVGLALSVVGALLIPFVVIVYALLVIAGVLGGFLAVAHAMGETYTRRRMAHGLAVSANSFRYLLTGLSGASLVWLAWLLFGWVPIAGSLILVAAALATWILMTVGLGASVLSRAGIRQTFAGRYVAPEMLTDEYLWATPQFGVPAVKRPGKTPDQRGR